MDSGLVPALDPLPLPGPVWLFHLLLVLTFFFHLLFLNLALGGTLLAAVARLTASGPDDFRLQLTGRLVAINTFGISLAITTGVAPLLFVQVLYQQYFYSATILLGWSWFAFLVLLLVGYYAVYLYKFGRASERARRGSAWLVLAAVMFFGIAAVHVAVHLIHVRPDRWAALADNPWAILGNPVYFPRLLHFVFASLAFSAMVLAWWSVRRARAGHDFERNSRSARWCWAWALWTTLLQVLDGFALLFLLPREVLLGLIGGGPATLLPLGTAVALGLALLMMLVRVSNPIDEPRLVTAVLAIMVATIALMSVTRQQVRVFYLEPFRDRIELVTAPQSGNIALFAVLLAVGLAVLAYMVGRVVREANAASRAGESR